MEKLKDMSVEILSVDTEDIFGLLAKTMGDAEATDITNGITEAELRLIAWEMFQGIYSHVTYIEELREALGQRGLLTSKEVE